MNLPAHRLDRALRRLDAWRRSPQSGPSEQGSYKEWLHFCVRLPGEPPGHLLVNFNVTERRAAAGTQCVARLITLAHAGEWHGQVESIPAELVRGEAGEIDVRFGASSLRLDGGVFELKLRSGDIAAELRLRPWMLPTGATRVGFDARHAMQWVAVARLAAEGTVSIGGRGVRLQDAPAYHDHNWGQFRWGGELAWEWGFVHPLDVDCPWTIVFVRVSDGARQSALNQFVLVWKGDAYLRAFQNRELVFELEGMHVGPRPFTIPGVMGLLAPGAASGVPAALSVRASGLGDELSIDYRTASKARVAMPSDVHALRSVLLNETEGSARVSGRIGGEAFEFAGSALLEVVRG
jgi:hypothetical protein